MTSFSTRRARILKPSEDCVREHSIPTETPIAIEYNGIGYAVMMATPTDLEDFALGFSLCEGIARGAEDVDQVDPFETERGILLKIQVKRERLSVVSQRVRTRVSESSCGLCGLKNLESVWRPLRRLPDREQIARTSFFKAIGALRDHQPINRATGGVRAAAYCDEEGKILITREDVGRHNALDKLIGALGALDETYDHGFILMSSRCSYELVEKAVMAGCSTLVTISTATSLAVNRAQAANLRLVSLARSDAMIEFEADLN
jgi:FdhD protein